MDGMAGDSNLDWDLDLNFIRMHMHVIKYEAVESDPKVARI